MTFNKNDIVCGLIFIGIGGLFAYNSFNLELGTPLRMGPGFFPLALSLILVALGIAVCLRSAIAEDAPMEFVPLRGLILILFPPILFGITVQGLGLALSLALVVLITSFASRRVTIPYAFAITLGLVAVSVAVFHYGLGLTIPLIGRWLEM